VVFCFSQSYKIISTDVTSDKVGAPAPLGRRKIFLGVIHRVKL